MEVRCFTPWPLFQQGKNRSTHWIEDRVGPRPGKNFSILEGNRTRFVGCPSRMPPEYQKRPLLLQWAREVFANDSNKSEHEEPSNLRLDIAIFWAIVLCSSYVNRRFGLIYQFYLQGRKIIRARNQSAAGDYLHNLTLFLSWSVCASTLKVKAVRSTIPSVAADVLNSENAVL
jgi:hypothetical protein